MQFRNLSAREDKKFRQWARKNWAVGQPINELWHPVVLDEITKMEAEHARTSRAAADQNDSR